MIRCHIWPDFSVTDLNADGIVNIIDLALAALNYRKNGPVTIGPGAE